MAENDWYNRTIRFLHPDTILDSEGKIKIEVLPDNIGGVTIDEVKADVDIASALFLKHSNATDHASGSDNQDLSGLVEKVTGHSLVPDTEITKLSGLNKITISPTEPSNPVAGETWIKTNT